MAHRQGNGRIRRNDGVFGQVLFLLSLYLCIFHKVYYFFPMYFKVHEFHDLQKDYALVPERLQIKEIIFSDYQRHLLQDEGFSKPPPKPVPSWRNKTSYIIQYRNLKLYLEQGYVLPISITFHHSINHHGWKATSTSTFVNVQLRKMILKKISLRWWATRSLGSLFYF